MNIEIIPLRGIKVDNKVIKLLDNDKDVVDILGLAYEKSESSLYYFNNELRFDFDEKGKIEFIEFLGGIDGLLQPQIYGSSAFEIDAQELYNILLKENNGDIDDNENGYCYGFLNISVGIYRDTTPESIQEMITEAIEDGEPMKADDIEYELRKANHWATIGIGVKNYYI